MDGRKGFIKFITIFLILSVLIPHRVSKYHFISDFILDLKFSKTSPPLAVLEDEGLPYFAHEPANINTKTFSLNSDSKSLAGAKKLTEIALSYKKNLLHLHKEPVVAPRQLGGLFLNKNSPNISLLKKAMNQKEIPSGADSTIHRPHRLPAVTTASQAFTKTSPRKNKEEWSAKITELVPSLSWQQQARLESAEGLEEGLSDLEETETFQEYAEKVIAKEVEVKKAPTSFVDKNSELQSQAETTQKTPSSFIEKDPAASTVLFSFPGWLVGAPVLDETKNKQNQLAKSDTRRETSNRKEVVDSEDVRPENIENDVPRPTVVATRAIDQENLYSKSLSQVFISGDIEMVGGLALTGQEKISVYHRVGGEVIGYGSVNLEKGRYEIFVNEPRAGILVGEVLRGEDVVGRAEILLPELLMKTKNTGALRETKMLLRPNIDQVTVAATSAYEPTQRTIIDDAVLNDSMVLKKRQHGFSTQMQTSSLIAKINKNGYWGGIKTGSSRQSFLHTLYPEGFVKSMFDLLKMSYSKNQGMIVGKIKIAGKEVAGATIESVGIELGSPIYFNSFLPDEGLKETSSVGMFSYVGLDSGAYVLRAKYKNKYLMSQVVLVEPGYVTEVDFDVQAPSLAEVYAFDIRSSQFNPVEISFLGAEKSVLAESGRQIISLAGTEGIQILQAQSLDDGFYKVRTTIEKSQKEILIPMIHQDWMAGLLSHTKYNTVPDTGVIVGLAQTEGFSLELDPQGYNEETQIFYFNSKGQILVGAAEAPEGGGVLAINVNSGLRGVLLKNSNRKTVRMLTSAVDSEAINVFSLSLR